MLRSVLRLSSATASSQPPAEPRPAVSPGYPFYADTTFATDHPTQPLSQEQGQVTHLQISPKPGPGPPLRTTDLPPTATTACEATWHRLDMGDQLLVLLINRSDPIDFQPKRLLDTMFQTHRPCSFLTVHQERNPSSLCLNYLQAPSSRRAFPRRPIKD